MAENLDGWVTKAEIRQKVPIKGTTLNNALTALKKKRIILAKPGVAGQYKLPTRSFAVWIRALTKVKEEEIVEEPGDAGRASAPSLEGEEIPNPEVSERPAPNGDAKR